MESPNELLNPDVVARWIAVTCHYFKTDFGSQPNEVAAQRLRTRLNHNACRTGMPRRALDSGTPPSEV